MGAGSAHPPAWSRQVRRFFRPFLSRVEKRRILDVIAEQQRRTTGRIIVEVIARTGRPDILDLAQQRCAALAMADEQNRGAVLVLIAHLDHEFAICGVLSAGDPADDECWQSAVAELLLHFADRRYGDGVVACVREIGRRLAIRFPNRMAA